MTLEQLKKFRAQILSLSSNFGITDIRVFGSVARGEAQPDSDIDFLVHLSKPIGFGFAGYVRKLSELLGCKVDVVSDKAVNSRIRDNVFHEAIPL